MRLFTLLLVWFSVLFVEVLSNNSSIGYEFLYFYYVYKMEIASGVSPRTIATGCPGTAAGGMCYFSEFAHYLMENRWKNLYEPTAGDKTLTPDASNLVKLNNNIPSSARFIINDLSRALHGVTSMPVVVNTLLNVANNAIATGNVDNDDVKAALANSEAAKLARAPNVFSDQMTAFEAEVEEAAQKYLVSQNSLVDWDATFEAIDDDEYDGKITEDEAESYKQSIRSFSLTFGTEGSGAARSTITHVAVMREFSTAIEQLNQRVVESSSDGSLRAPSDICDADFVAFGSDSDKRKRHLVEISSVVGKRKPMLARIPIPGISGKKVLRFGSEL